MQGAFCGAGGGGGAAREGLQSSETYWASEWGQIVSGWDGERDLAYAALPEILLCGLVQVFLKAGVLPRLEKQRERLISQSLTFLQAACKGFLSRQKYRRVKVSLPHSHPPTLTKACLMWQLRRVNCRSKMAQLQRLPLPGCGGHLFTQHLFPKSVICSQY